MSENVSKEIKDVVVEGTEFDKAAAVLENLSQEEQERIQEMLTGTKVTVSSEPESKMKKAWGWVKEKKWYILGAAAAAGTVFVLGKKAYQAGMPAEFDAYDHQEPELIDYNENLYEEQEPEIEENGVSEETEDVE
jgi:hypothetical protein